MAEPINEIQMNEVKVANKRGSSIIEKLIKPYASVTDVSTVREVRFLSSILLMFAMLTSVRLLVGLISGSAQEEQLSFYILVGLTAVLFVAYVVSRTKYYRMAPFLAVTAVTGLIYATFLTRPDFPQSTLLWLIPIAVFASIVISTRSMVIYVAINFFFLLVLPSLVPALTYGPIALPVSLYIVVSLLLLVLNQYRDSIERLRQQALRESNQELQILSQSLEVRVNERVRDLALATEVGRVISEIKNLDELLSQSVTLIRDRFDLYYVQIYLTNEANNKLMLRSGTGAAGEVLLARQHALNIDLTSINGRVAFHKEPIIVADTETSDIFLPNVDLPETRSEMAVPLIVQDTIVGVIDLQSSEPNALSEENLPAFTSLAGQLAIAIENSSLLTEMENTTNFLDSVLDNLPVMLFVKDAQDLRYVRWNKQGALLTGVPAEEFIGKTDFDFFPAEQAEFFIGKDRDVLNGGQLVDIPEEPLENTDHETRYLHTIKVPIMDARGNPRYLLGISEDITERKEIARQLEGRVAQLGLLNEIGRMADETSNIGEMLQWATTQIPQAMSFPESCVSSITLDGVVYGRAEAASYPRHIVEELRLGNNATGHICIAYKNNLYEFHNEESALIGNVGRRISNFVENQRLIDQIQRQTDALQAVAEIGTAVAAINHEQELLQLVVELTNERFDLYQTGIYLIDNAGVILNLQASAGQAGQQMVARKEFFRVDNNQVQVSLAARSRTEVVVNDVAQNLHYIVNPLLPLVKSEMSIPLIAGENKVIGVLQLQAKVIGRFTQQDIDIFNTLALQVAVALQNTRQYEQTQSALDELNALQRVITGEGWQAFRQGQTNLVKGYSANRQAVSPISDSKGYGTNGDVVVPLMVRGTSIGKLGIKNPENLSLEDKGLIEAISRQVAEALERARLFEESEVARQQTNALYTGSEQVVRATSAEEVLGALAESTAIGRMEQASLLFFDSVWDDVAPEMLETIAVWEKSADSPSIPVGTTFPTAVYPIFNVLDRDTPLIIEDTATFAGSESTKALFERFGTQSAVAFPLIAGDAWIGILTAQSGSTTKFSAEEVKQIASLASQASVVVRTQRLFNETEARAEQEQILRQVSERVYGAIDAESVLKTAVQEVSRSLGLEAFIYLDENS